MTVLRLLVALACVAVPGWVLVTRWAAVLAGHPVYPVLLGLLVATGVVLLMRHRAPRTGGPARTTGRVVGALLLVGVVAAAAWLRPFPADPVPRVDAVETATTWELRPAGATTGLVFVPGARVDPRAYLALLAPVADAGHLVVVPKPPLGIALLDPGAPGRAFDAHPGVPRWVVGGHSLGGTAAATAVDDPRVGGLLLWASYPAGDLSASTLDVLSVSGDRDGLATPADIDRTRPLLPPGSAFVTVPGGVHAFFGDYGAQPGDGEPGVDRAAAQRRIVEVTVTFVGSVT